MTAADSAFRKSELALLGVLALLAMSLMTIAIVPKFRTAVKEAFLPLERTILAKVSGSIGPEGPQVTALKIRERDKLSLEIYLEDEEQGRQLSTKVPLFESRDGYFVVNGNATNLALTDVDQDGQMEIVAPTFNEQMVPRLNIFRYNRASQSFDRVNAPEDSALPAQ